MKRGIGIRAYRERDAADEWNTGRMRLVKAECEYAGDGFNGHQARDSKWMQGSLEGRKEEKG